MKRFVQRDKQCGYNKGLWDILKFETTLRIAIETLR